MLSYKIWTLSRDNDDANENGAQKITFAFSEQIRDDFYSFSLFNVAELSRS